VPKPTADELAAAHDAQDWNALWLAAIPLVKFTIKRMIQRGEIDPSRWADGDLKQEGLLAAGRAVRSWNTLEGTFNTWITAKVRAILLEFRDKTVRNGFGGGGDPPFLVSAQEELWIDNEPDDEPDAVKQDMFTYPEDEVFLAPETAVDREIALRFLHLCDSTDQLILRLLFGVDCEPKTVSQIADLTGVSRSSAHRAIDRLRRLTKPG
jgi:DNA-directed RNA polymerase specialized sigma subunit